MPLLSKVGRKSFRTRLLVALLYALLLAGAVAMLYPLGLMLSGSTQSVADLHENRLVPRFLVSDEALWQKHLEALFNESLDALNIAFRTDYPAFNAIPLPPPGAAPHAEWLPAYRRFLQDTPLPPTAITLGHYWAPQAGAFPAALRAFHRHLREKYGTLDALNAALRTDFDAWYNVFVQPPAYLFPHALPHATPLADALDTYKPTAPDWQKTLLSPEGFYIKLYLKPRYGRDIATYNAAHGTTHPSWDTVTLPPTCPDPTASPEESADWQDFTTRALNPLWLTGGAGVPPANDQNQPTANSSLVTRHSSLTTPDLQFRAWLLLHPDALPQNLPPSAIATAPLPQFAHHADLFRQHIPELRREFLLRNYRTVLDYLLFHGRGILNTVVYCILAVLVALLVNPLAAYALSRGNLRHSTQILFFLMLTMAFPHMVTQIPVFLLLREFGLLNTFAALILPGAASGYSIFLLKGFFDSLPRDLYESAQLDGAGEWTLFWHITMRLSTPILSVIALQAFTLAYANFMYALLICQSPKMWTLMVWLYQLQQRTGPGVVQASLILAALPTLLVFLACQRVLLRGIVVPIEK